MAVISISGRIGSGKDEVAKIIQKLTSKAFNVEDEFGGRERDQYGKYVVEYRTDWVVKKFAWKLKLIASLLTGFPVEKFEDQEFKASYLPDQWAYLPKDEILTDGIGLSFKKMTVREFLQKLGTDAIRDGLHVNTWVNALFSDYVPSNVCGCNNACGCENIKYPNWIITDCRFPNEYDVVKSHGGVVIRINRDLPGLPYKTLEDLHLSETALDNFTFDKVIDNNGTLQDLETKVKEFLIEFGFL